THGASLMLESLAAEIAALPRRRVSELRAKFAEVCGEPTPSHNKVWLVKRIAWRLQAKAEGDLSERDRRRAAELVSGADGQWRRERCLRHRPAHQGQHQGRRGGAN